jgi:hypothetical protein
LLEGRLGKPSTYPLAEILDGVGHSGKFHSLTGLSLKLPLLRGQGLFPLFEVFTAPLVLRQRDDLSEIGLGQPLQLASEGSSALVEVLLAGL